MKKTYHCKTNTHSSSHSKSKMFIASNVYWKIKLPVLHENHSVLISLVNRTSHFKKWIQIFYYKKKSISSRLQCYMIVLAYKRDINKVKAIKVRPGLLSSYLDAEK